MILRDNTGTENDLTSIVVSELAASGLDSARGERRCTTQKKYSKSPKQTFCNETYLPT